MGCRACNRGDARGLDPVQEFSFTGAFEAPLNFMHALAGLPALSGSISSS